MKKIGLIIVLGLFCSRANADTWQCSSHCAFIGDNSGAYGVWITEETISSSANDPGTALKLLNQKCAYSSNNGMSAAVGISVIQEKIDYATIENSCVKL